MAPEGKRPPLRKRFVAWLLAQPEAARRRRRLLLYLLRLALHIARQVSHDRCPQRAAALSYTTVLTMVPVTALFVLYFKMAGKLEALSGIVQDWVLRVFVAEPAREIAVYIEGLVANVHVRTLGTVGVGGLLVSAYILFRTIEGAFNDVWKVRSQRKFLTRVQILSSILVLVPAFLFVSFYLSGKLQGVRLLGAYENLSRGAKLLLTYAPFLLTIPGFFFLFRLTPNTRVNARPALLGAVTAAVFFELAKWPFNSYVVHVLPVSRLYGSLGVIPITLIWMYFSWLIVLIGSEISYTVQNLRDLHRELEEQHRPKAAALAVHEEWGLAIVRALSRRFERAGGPVAAESVAEDLAIATSMVQDHLSLLVEAGYAAEIEGDASSGYLLTRPAGTLTDAEIAGVFRRHLGLN